MMKIYLFKYYIKYYIIKGIISKIKREILKIKINKNSFKIYLSIFYKNMEATHFSLSLIHVLRSVLKLKYIILILFLE